MNAWDVLAATTESAYRHVSDHWTAEQISGYLDLIDDALVVKAGYPAQVMDLGCGVGRLAIPYSHRHRTHRVLGIDASDAMIRHAGNSANVFDRISFHLNDGCTLPETGMLDGGWSILMFQHVPNETMINYLIQIAERLKPGARFLFQFVLDAELGPLSYPRHLFVAADMVDRAGLKPIDTRSGLMEESWCWMTVEKPA